VLGANPQRKFTVPVEVSVLSYYDVEAENAAEAEEKVTELLRNGEESLLQESSEATGTFEVLSEGIIEKE
jgi:hypothetical protein